MALAAMLGLVAAGMAAAQAQDAGDPTGSWRIRGVVTGPHGYGIGGVRIEVQRLALSCISADDGRFELQGTGAGVAQLALTRPGYVPRVVEVAVGPGADVQQDMELAVEGEAFQQAIDDVKVKLYREGGFSPLVWFVPRLGLVVRFTRPALRTAQDRLFDMFSAVMIARDALAPFPYLGADALLVSEAVTPDEHLLRSYPRGPLLQRLAGSAPLDLPAALAWTEQYYDFYRDGRSSRKEVPGWQSIQSSLDQITEELFVEPEAGGVYVPGYGLVFHGLPARQFPAVMALSVLSMVLAVRVPVPDGDWIFVQFEDQQVLWAMEAPVQTIRRLVASQQAETFELDLEAMRDVHVYRNGVPWSG